MQLSLINKDITMVPHDCLGHKYLTPINQISVADAYALACNLWNSSYQSLTLQKYSLTMKYFTYFAYSHGVNLIVDVTADLIYSFAYASVYKYGILYRSSEQSIKIRLSSLRWLYRSLQLIGYTELIDITRSIPLPTCSLQKERFITEEIADQLLFYSHLNYTYKEPVIIGLLLSGVWSDEIMYLTISDFNAETSTINVHGTGQYCERILHLEPYIARSVQQRIEYLSKNTHTHLLCAKRETSPAYNQSDIITSLRRVICYTKLATEGITPSSLITYAARCMFEATNHIEDVAKLLGLRTLDAAASIIDYRWQNAYTA